MITRNAADRAGVRVAAIFAVDTITGCTITVVPVKRQRIVHGVHGGDPRASRSALTNDGAARGEALWTPWAIGTRAVHAAELSPPTRWRRSEGPLRSMRCARWMMRSRMASPRVGSPITSCHRLTGTWLVISKDPLS